MLLKIIYFIFIVIQREKHELFHTYELIESSVTAASEIHVPAW